MSLISDNLTDNDSFSNKRSLSATYTFAGLFEIGGTETGVLTHPNKNISLPATSLQNSCYRGMFYHCSGLTVAPALPSMSVPALGYFQMFSRTGLVKAPDLPATAIEQQSYAKMFQDCSALTTGPERLPAQKLKTSCYYQMFKGCTSLTTAPILCATTFPDWPTETCYGEMFYGCSHLQSVICYNTTKVSSTNSSDTPNYKTYTENWLYGVNSSGTFYTNNSSKWKTGSPHGIPSGWTTASIPAQ